ncbi:MAG: restriction endonuclease subunit S, partial [Candidatus Kuenenbacteria bacterium]
VEIMAKAYQEKKEKEAEAGKLLESIDDYVLNELGIQMSEIKKEMIFEVRSNEIKDRLDCEYYQKFYKIFINEIKKSKFQKEKLKNITEFVISGRTPAKDDYTENIEDGVPIIKAGTASGKLVNLRKLEYVKNGFKGKQVVKKGDIFILSAAHQAEYVGKNVSLLDEELEKDTYFVGELINVRANSEKCLSEYLFSFLSSHYIFILINREKRGQTSHLYSDDLKNLLIPLPPLTVQKKIVDKLKFSRTQAQKLKNEANNNLQKAKAKVEEIILG